MDEADGGKGGIPVGLIPSVVVEGFVKVRGGKPALSEPWGGANSQVQQISLHVQQLVPTWSTSLRLTHGLHPSGVSRQEHTMELFSHSPALEHVDSCASSQGNVSKMCTQLEAVNAALHTSYVEILFMFVLVPVIIFTLAVQYVAQMHEKLEKEYFERPDPRETP
eukprot:508955-Amphidinium_carterae.1